MSQYGSQNVGDGNNLTVGDYANGMPNIRLSEIPRSFARQLPWMLIAALIMIAASWWFTKDIKRQYVADGRIMVKVGPEHVYNPDTGIKSSGINFTPDQIALTEIGIIKNDEIIDQVIHQMIDDPVFGGERFAPKLYDKWAEANPDDKIDRWNDIVKYVDKSYSVTPSPKSSIVDLSFKHEDGAVAVKALDVFMVTYQNFRNDIFVTEQSDLIGERRAATEEQLGEVEAKIQSILNRNDISDFDSEQKGVQKRRETLRTELNTLQGRLSAVEAALAASEDQLRNTPETVDLYIDDRARARLAQAELEKSQLLAKYLPTSRPVRKKEAEIEQLRAQIAANGGKPTGGRRVGPNTVYQALLTQRNTYQAQADSYREQEITLQRQLNSADAKVKRMRQLGPTYKNLVREKVALEETLKSLNAKEQVALVNQQQQETKADNITIISRPTFPRKGRNMSKIMFVLSVLGSLFTIFMLALLRVFLDPKLYGPAPAARLSTPMPAPVYGYDPSIPEPVPAYQPEPMPAAAPAYAPAAYEPVEYDPAAYAAPTGNYGQVGGAPYEPTGGNAAQAYGGAAYDATAQAYPDSAPQMYADGSYAGTAPLVSAPAVSYEAVAAPSPAPVPAAQEYAGPDSSIPVLGKIEPINSGV